MKVLLSLLFVAMLTTTQTKAQSAPLERSEKQAVVDRAGDLLVENYVFPDRGALAKTKISQALGKGAYDGLSDPSAFAERLTTDLQSVTHDKHLRVFGPPTAPPGNVQPGLPQPTSYAGFAQIDRLKGNIGYIKVLGFPPPGPFNVVAAQAMRDLAGTNALIIDMRDNGGGSPQTVEYLCSFFFDPKTPVHINDLIYRKPGTDEFITTSFQTEPVATPYLNKPVYLLTSKRTFSGGEEFVNDLKVQNRAKIFGETTGGGANPGGIKSLNSRFRIFIPNGRAENPVTKSNWDGIGVVPTVAVDEKLAFHDAVLDIIAQFSVKALGSKSELAAIREDLAQNSAVDPLIEAHLLKIRTAALPGSAAAVRRNIEELASGVPNFALMSKDLADATRQQLPQLQADMSKLGAIQSVTFKFVGPGGLDVYDVKMANGMVRSGIFVSSDGTIVSAWIQPASTPIVEVPAAP